ncbi:MAG: glycosyltransferase [Candidatus Brocadiia bacterium]
MRRPRAFLITSYETGAARGKHLGIPGYSYDIVTQLFVPMLRRQGQVILVSNPSKRLDAEAERLRKLGLAPLHIAFLPPQDVTLARAAPNIIVPAWEFPDIPNQEYRGNARHNWPAVAARCSLVIVGGPFTRDAFLRGGVTTPIKIVPIPVPDSYFHISSWQSSRVVRMECPCYVFHAGRGIEAGAKAGRERDLTGGQGDSGGSDAKSPLRVFYRHAVRPLLPPRVACSVRAALEVWAETGGNFDYARASSIDLSEVVYVSILNPGDGRKNWSDLLTGFVHAMKDYSDATLVIKLIADNKEVVRRVMSFYRACGIAHRCKVVFIPGYLREDQLLQLAQASTYYVQATRAEGNCLPLMNYMAAGRPAVTPCHSAIGDYWEDAMGFRVESHPELARWPQTPALGARTSWARIVWPSLVEQIARSYHVAKRQDDLYRQAASRSREKILSWAGMAQVESRLVEAIESVEET